MSSSLIQSLSLTNTCIKYTVHITQQGNYHIRLMRLCYNPNNPHTFYELEKGAYGTDFIASRFSSKLVFDTIEEADDVGSKACKEVRDNKLKQYQHELEYIQERIDKLKSKPPKRTFRDMTNK